MSDKFNVHIEDHWDYYKNPPIRPLLARLNTYEEAVEFAKNKVVALLDSLLTDPASIYIIPEPKGEHFDSRAYENELRIRDQCMSAEKLVKERILGTRKGLRTQNFEHSIRVSKKLQEFGYDNDVILAGMLHDIVEDGNTSLDELKKLGYSEEVVYLVDLCSHDESIKDRDDRWLSMMVRVVKEKNKYAMAIKMCDLIDNLSESDSLSLERRKNMRLLKLPTLLRLSEELMIDTVVWKELHLTALEFITKEADLLFLEHGDELNSVKISGKDIKKMNNIVNSFSRNVVAEVPPQFVIIMGGVGAGKTTIRRKKFTQGFVHFDFGDIYTAVKLEFEEGSEKLTNITYLISSLIIKEALERRSNIVIEIIGDDKKTIDIVMEKMTNQGYEISIEAIVCDPVEAYKRHLKAVENDQNYISSHFTQEATLSFF